MTEQFICAFCLERVEVRQGEPYPDICPYCKTGFCNECGSPAKPSSNFCTSCGAVEPKINPRHARSGSIGANLMTKEWMERNSKTGDTYLIIYDCKDRQYFLAKEKDNPLADYKRIKELTKEEVDRIYS